MAVDKFKFVSPGIFIDEIDESTLEPLPERMGPLIIGRFQKGPGARPTKVDSFKEFVSVFGAPHAGNASGDIWRTGEPTAPTYAAYAAQAWLKNNRPATVYRVMGDRRSDADPTGIGVGGWNTDASSYSFPGSNATSLHQTAGAYGMFLIPSMSLGTAANLSHSLGPVTGTLAAIWYVDAGAIALTGTARNGDSAAAAARWFRGTNGQFTAIITGSSGVLKKATFNFQPQSSNFIRKVFNTNPTLTNGDLGPGTPSTEIYWLGETFESNVTPGENSQLYITGSEASSFHSDQLACILALDGTGQSGIVWANHKKPTQAAQTGWFISQDLRGSDTASFNPTNGSHVENLFKFHALDSGEHANRDYKISILDIKPPKDHFNKFATFTVVIRDGRDIDEHPIVLERYSNVSLNPQSANYLARVIGDRHFYFNESSKTLTDLGNYGNRSKFVRVEVSPNVNNGEAKAGWFPMGVRGPVVPKTYTWFSGSKDSDFTQAWYAGSGSSNALPNNVLVNLGNSAGVGGAGMPSGMGEAELFYTKGAGAAQPGVGSALTASIEFPKSRLRVSSSEGSLANGKKCFFGYQSNLKNTKRYDWTNVDLLRGTPTELNSFALGDDQYSWVFTLDDVCELNGDTSNAVYVSGSRAAGVSFSAKSGSSFVLTGTLAGYNRFTSPMFGGFDGFDVKEKDPLRNTYISKTQGEKTNHTYYSLKKAIDITSDAEFIEFDVACMPGITNSSLNTLLISSCEERGDALAIIDLLGNYQPPHEKTGDESDNLGDVPTVVNAAKDLSLNTSYGCTFYPFVQIRDTISDSILYVPPSVVALGTFSSSQRKSAVWFAPAGFTRGGLSVGSSGLPVVGVRQRLTSDDRDELYDVNINPIASFPAEGIVIFGQKTLQVTPSALDRINVRRLLIHVKKEVSRFAATTLFEPNVQATWDSFRGKVEPFLDKVKAGFGLTDYRVVLDETTTTPDLIDRNVLYAKIYLKPARAIEFIALDFIITKSGASFDD